MNNSQFRRYSRHILLEEIDEQGQNRLLSSHALIIGLGGLGSAAAMYLASSGVGTLTLCDFDTVDLSNLQRQIIHDHNSIHNKKVKSAQNRLNNLNPDIHINTIDHKLDPLELEKQIAASDIVLDASDNFATRYLINKASVSTNTPLVSAAAIRYQGQLTTLLPQHKNSPCYHCLYPNSNNTQNDTESCSQLGIFAPLTGVIGSLQAAEALKILGQFGQPLYKKLLSINLLDVQHKMFSYEKDPTCPICSDNSCPPPIHLYNPTPSR